MTTQFIHPSQHTPSYLTQHTAAPIWSPNAPQRSYPSAPPQPTPPICGRFAPSPTGALHLGNLRTALLAWLFARSANGSFILRIEDLDLPRVRPGATSGMLADLRWLGLDWDAGPDHGGPTGPYYQSARTAMYHAALARLRSADRLYPCYCTRAQRLSIASAPQVARTPTAAVTPNGALGSLSPTFASSRVRSHSPLSPVATSSCHCSSLTTRQRRQREASGRSPALRFRVLDAETTFTDLLAGSQAINLAQQSSDFIVQRSDGVIAYQLAVVVDDALMGVTQVARGEDLLSSTAYQLALYDALGYQRPLMYAHAPLALDSAGQRLAKRDAAAGVAQLRAADPQVTPAVVRGALAASCGLWPRRESASLDDLLRVFQRWLAAPPETGATVANALGSYAIMLS